MRCQHLKSRKQHLSKGTWLFAFVLIIFCQGCQISPAASSAPKIILWAWERRENLEFIDTRKFGVAFLAQTLELKGDEVRLIPRRQPLKVKPETYLIAVTRIEIPKKSSDWVALSEKQRSTMVEFVLKTLDLKNVSAVQLDFDVTVSEREFYRLLLADLRIKLPANVGLTITALASWCASDSWLSGLPIEDAVPMAFVMGADDKMIRDFLASGQDWQEPKCRGSYGIAIDEPLKMKFKPNRKFYLFNPNPNGWQPTDLDRLPDGV